VLAYKFLTRDGATLIRREPWPTPAGAEPGPWVEAAQVRPCREGIHACRPRDLAYWIHHELWEIELEGEVVDGLHKVVARRGRLRRRLPAWSADVAPELGTWCAWRCSEHALSVLRGLGERDTEEELMSARTVDDLGARAGQALERLGESSAGGAAVALVADAVNLTHTDHYAGAPFAAALAAGHAATWNQDDRDAYNQAFAAERGTQSGWIARRLELC
jgi:hypothetical protein